MYLSVHALSIHSGTMVESWRRSGVILSILVSEPVAKRAGNCDPTRDVSRPARSKRRARPLPPTRTRGSARAGVCAKFAPTARLVRGEPVRQSAEMTQQLRLAVRMNGAWAFSRDIEAARRGAIQCHWENGAVIGDQNDSAVGRRASSGAISECRQALVTLIVRQRERAGGRVGTGRRARKRARICIPLTVLYQLA
ncbi:hypothetical protein HYPSUDRAFT_538530 [Hypholoma sublateritium FD-334 SS-4]|uniref:Uncharacterized protein n=1 Tax=Hypholoma sublateritium (strain FD-334 SS-4) TaxID=945553 RepID=A0A0D2P6I5_HYPSF|nr:hypothetical protein HYPSUDRAFT_538530 [Hypholoma sublateritium FD-334 SS-4]